MLWVLCAIVVLALGVLSVALGNGFLPSFSQASEAGTIIPLLVAWALIATAVALCAHAGEVFVEQSESMTVQAPGSVFGLQTRQERGTALLERGIE